MTVDFTTIILLGLIPAATGVLAIIFLWRKNKSPDKIELEAITTAEINIREESLLIERIKKSQIYEERNLTKNTKRYVVIIEESRKKYKTEISIEKHRKTQLECTQKSNKGYIIYLQRDKLKKGVDRYTQLDLKDIDILEGIEVPREDVGKILSQLIEQEISKKQENPLLFGMTRMLVVVLIGSLAFYAVMFIMSMYMTQSTNGIEIALTQAINHLIATQASPVP